MSPMSDAPARSASDVEKTVTDVIQDLTAGRVGRGAAEQIKDAAERRIGKATRDESFHRAVNRP